MNMNAWYNRATEAKKLVSTKVAIDELDAILTGIRAECEKSTAQILHDVVADWTYDERCVIAASLFQNWKNKVEFQMPKTKDVVSKMMEKDREGDKSFVAVVYRWIEDVSGEDDRTCRAHHRTSIFSNQKGS